MNLPNKDQELPVKKFEFPLARVAKWSQQKLSVEQLTLLRALKDVADVDQRLRDLRNQVTECQSKMQTQVSVTGYELQMLTRYLQTMGVEHTRLHSLGKRLVAKAEEQRRRVVAEHRQVKLFENLKDRRFQEWEQERSKEEDALASDLFLAKLARDMRQAPASSSPASNI